MHDDLPPRPAPGAADAPHDAAEQDQRQEIHRLRQELDESTALEQARGILMERYGYDADQAGRALSRLARQHGVGRRAYADFLVATAPDPRGWTPAAVSDAGPLPDQDERSP